MNTEFYIDPSAATSGNGTRHLPYNSWSQVKWLDGYTYYQRAGTTYSDTVVVSGSNIAIAPYDRGASPQIKGAYFNGASNVTMAAFSITGNTVAGVLFANGASGNVVGYCDISENPVGVMVATGAGTGNRVSGNTIHDNSIFGVDICQGATGQIVSVNTISNNGSHGVEIEGDGNTVTCNAVSNNGVTVPGSSGIHTYPPNATTDGGNNNTISFNLVSGTHDCGTGDGNGIEIDQWSHGNVVHGNLTHGNDGAGIIVYGAHDNQVTANLSFSNQQGNASNHGLHAELAFNTDPTPAVADPNYGNTIADNIALATIAGATDLFIDANSQKQTIGTNYLGAGTFAAASENWLAWWATQGVPATLQAAAKAAIATP